MVLTTKSRRRRCSDFKAGPSGRTEARSSGRRDYPCHCAIQSSNITTAAKLPYALQLERTTAAPTKRPAVPRKASRVNGAATPARLRVNSSSSSRYYLQWKPVTPRDHFLLVRHQTSWYGKPLIVGANLVFALRHALPATLFSSPPLGGRERWAERTGQRPTAGSCLGQWYRPMLKRRRIPCEGMRRLRFPDVSPLCRTMGRRRSS
jgi:hypothetical protein